MRERRKALERLLAVQTQLHQLEEARLAEIRRRLQAAEADQRAMFGILGDETKTDALLLGFACRHIRSNDAQTRELASAEQAQKQVLMQRAAQKKALAKIFTETTLSVARDDEKRALMEIGERLAGQATSLP